MPRTNCSALIVAVGVLLASIIGGGTVSVSAASIVVTTADDEAGLNGTCSLREALTNAADDAQTFADCQAGAGHDTITFNLGGPATLDVTVSLPPVSDPDGTTIDGAGLITIDGRNNNRAGFRVDPGATATFRGLTFVNGGNTGGGGALWNKGSIKVFDSTFRDNHIPGGVGSAILTENSTSVELYNSTISGNSGMEGAAIFVPENASLTIANSTISGNTAEAGGIIYGQLSATVIITNSTITGNTTGGLPLEAAIVAVGGTTVSLYNTIVADQVGGMDCYVDDATLTAGSDNLDSDGTCDGSTTGSANLGPLQDNGGPTYTHALLNGSDAINTGDSGRCAAGLGSPSFGAGGEDQRGIARPQGTQCDTGAYELCLGDTDCDGVGNALDQCSNTDFEDRPL
jgi:CSLREA domain-containing protein